MPCLYMVNLIKRLDTDSPLCGQIVIRQQYSMNVISVAHQRFVSTDATDDCPIWISIHFESDFVLPRFLD